MKRSEAIINMLDATEHELHRFSYRGATNLSIGYFSPFDDEVNVLQYPFGVVLERYILEFNLFL